MYRLYAAALLLIHVPYMLENNGSENALARGYMGKVAKYMYMYVENVKMNQRSQKIHLYMYAWIDALYATTTGEPLVMTSQAGFPNIKGYIYMYH